jgi:hypothetical protein
MMQPSDTIGSLILDMAERGWQVSLVNVRDLSGPPETWDTAGRVWVVTMTGLPEVAGRSGKGAGGVVVALGRQPSLMDALNEARADAMGKEQGA